LTDSKGRFTMTEENQTAEPAKARGARPSRHIDYRDPELRRRPGTRKGKLDASVPEGLTGRWVLDLPGRVNEFVERGWKFAEQGRDGVLRESANDAPGNAIRINHALVGEGGESVKQYLMLIPTELYEEDKAFYERRRQEIIEQMETGQYGSDLGDKGYVGAEGARVRKR
jgi:hypothetical protein